MMLKYAIFIVSVLVLVSFLGDGDCRAAESDAKDKDFAAQAADALDSALLQFKNSFSDLFDDSSKISSFFTNVTNSFKKLTEKDPAQEATS